MCFVDLYLNHQVPVLRFKGVPCHLQHITKYSFLHLQSLSLIYSHLFGAYSAVSASHLQHC